MEKVVNKTEKMVNKVELNGHVGLNPEVTNLKDGKKLVRFTMATNEGYKNQNGEWKNETVWHKIVMWNKVADQALNLVKKGTKINITGKISYNNFTDGKGVKFYNTEIIAFSFEIIKVEKPDDALVA